MKPRFLLALATCLAVTALALNAAASTPSAVTYSLTQADQKTRAPAHRRCWGMSFTRATAFKVLLETSGAANEQFWLYNAQAGVSCLDRRQGTAHRAGALACWVQVRAGTATVSLGLSYSGTPTIYNLGESAGTISYLNDSGTGAEAQGACFPVTAGGGMTYVILPGSAFADTSAATYRSKACADGRPCRVNGDCSADSSSCASTRVPTGAYLGIVPTSTTVDCVVCEAR